jgi:S-DNA-T family DNA segregation ATPase FtsK/SpoIIIE
MEMTLTVHTPRRRPRPVEVVVRWSGAHQAADLCAALSLHLGMPVSFLTSHGSPVPAASPVGSPPLVHGASVAVGSGFPQDITAGGHAGTAIELVVVGGPDAGRSRPLVPPGVRVGRGFVSGLSLADDALSRVHALVRVGPTGIAIEDAGSTNGILVDGQPVAGPTRVDTSSTIVLGRSTLRVRRGPSSGIPVDAAGDGTIVLRQTAAPAPSLGTIEVEWPVAPAERPRARIPWVGALLPVPIGVALAWLLGPQLLLFTLLGPVALLANASVDRWGVGRARRRDSAAHVAALRAAEHSLALALRTEVVRLDRAHPDPHDVLLTAEHRLSGLWRSHGLQVRLGMGEVTTRVVRVDGTDRTHPRVRHGPVVLDLEAVGTLGVVGPPEATTRLLHNVVGQLCTRNAPRRLSVSVASDDTAWEWVRRMPHTTDSRGRSPTAGHRHLVVVPDAGTALGATALADERATTAVAVVAALDRSALPAGCRAVVTDAGNGRHDLDVDGRRVTFSLDLVGPWWSDRVARALAPLRCAGAGAEMELPTEVALTDVLGLGQVTADEVLARWKATDPGSSSAGRPPVAVVGVAREGPHTIDLRRDGPHVLVGGTTGSGKSELLRTLVTSLALSCPPKDLTFVLVDFKGGAAFGSCARLPHVVGLVTDLDEHLVGRALASLGAEIRRRERLFAAAGVSDVDAYARTPASASEPVPRLVVVIDELRALVDEVPDFVRGLIRLAALGRSLGIHVVLATQRPSGAVTAEIQANVNLRIALRMRDRSDSSDVIDDPAAAAIPSSTPGRALLRGGDGSLVSIQTATVEAAATCEQRFLTVDVGESLGDSPEVTRPGAPVASAPVRASPRLPPVTSTLVEMIVEAHTRTRAAAPRTPWPAPLPDRVPALTGRRSPTVLGLVDEPDLQRVSPLVWSPTVGWLLSGRPRSGRTTALRAVALGAAAARPADRLHVHLIDVDGSLADLTQLPHVGTHVDAGDARTISQLTSLVGDEVRRRKAVRNGPLRVDGAKAEDPTILLVVDGWDQLLEARSAAADPGAMPGDGFLRVLRDGQGVGILAAVAGGRSLLQARWSGLGCDTFLLGAADPLDLALAGLRQADLPTMPPPGRGIRLRDGRTVQFAAATPETTSALAEWSRRPPADRAPLVVRALPPVARRPRPAPAADRFTTGGGPPGGGVWPAHEDSPEALGLGLSGPSPQTWAWAPHEAGRRLVIAGPQGSGRTNALRVLAESVVAAGRVAVVVRPGRAPRSVTFPCTVLAPSDAEVLMRLRRRHPDLVALVDDVHSMDETRVLQPLREIAELVDRDGGLVAVTTLFHALVTRFRGLDVDIARHGTALLLSPRPTDGEPFGIRRLDGIPPIPGRGVFVHHRSAAEVQVFLADDESARAVSAEEGAVIVADDESAGAVSAGEGAVIVADGEGSEAGRRRDGDDDPADEAALPLDEPDADRDEQKVPDDGGSAGPHRLSQPPPAERAEAGRPDEDEQGRHEHPRGVAALTGSDLVHVERGEAGEHRCLHAGEECGEAAGAA